MNTQATNRDLGSLRLTSSSSEGIAQYTHGYPLQQLQTVPTAVLGRGGSEHPDSRPVGWSGCLQVRRQSTSENRQHRRVQGTLDSPTWSFVSEAQAWALCGSPTFRYYLSHCFRKGKLSLCRAQLLTMCMAEHPKGVATTPLVPQMPAG